MYRIACGHPSNNGWGVAPSEFWSMTVPEWWLMFEANVGGGIRADQEAKERVKELYLKFKEQERQQ